MKKDLSILIVDDDLDIVDLLESLLRQEFQFERIDKLYSGSAAIEYLQEYPTDLVFCDMVMPKMTGLDVLETLNKQHIYYRFFVFISGNDKTVESAVHALKIGAFDYLEKPFDHSLRDCILNIFSFIEKHGGDAQHLADYSGASIKDLVEDIRGSLDALEDKMMVRTNSARLIQSAYLLSRQCDELATDTKNLLSLSQKIRMSLKGHYKDELEEVASICETLKNRFRNG